MNRSIHATRVAKPNETVSNEQEEKSFTLLHSFVHLSAAAGQAPSMAGREPAGMHADGWTCMGTQRAAVMRR